MAQTAEFRSSSGRGLTIASAAVALGVLALLVVQGSWQQLLGFGTLPLLFTALVWATMERPYVRVSNGGIEIHNVVRAVMVPWPAVTDIDLRWGLRLITRLGNFSAWSVPAPARPGYVSARSRASQRRAHRPADGLTRRPDEAAQAVMTRWQALRQAGHLDNPRLESDRPDTSWNWPELTVLAVLIVLSIAGIGGYQLSR